jgi:hypothetical protein
VRDARAEGCQERRAGRNRDLARRSRDLNEDVLRLGAAIVADTGAFLAWNLAARSPSQLARDLGTALSRPAPALWGILRFATGLVLLAAAAVLILPLTITVHTFTVLETWTVLAGLLVAQLVGVNLRARND